ncbi:MAG: hypothetical protein IKT44_00005 [Clostridia bacterium]|nr:hypothetical protein [Clostridia bacterium]
MNCENCGKTLEQGETCDCVAAEPPLSKAKQRAKKALTGIILFVVAFIGALLLDDVIENKYSQLTDIERITNNIKFEAIASDFVIKSTKQKYSTGELHGNVYTNEWANLKIELDERFTEASQAQYEAYANLLTDCAAYFIAEGDGDELGIVFYKGGMYSVKEYCDKTIESWMDAVRKHVNAVFSPEYIKNIVYEKNAIPVEIAGENYLGAFLTVRYENGLSTVYGDYCAKKDRKIIDIVVVADSLEENLSIVNDFESYK